jgi:hypothetical protein
MPLQSIAQVRSYTPSLNLIHLILHRRCRSSSKAPRLCIIRANTRTLSVHKLHFFAGIFSCENPEITSTLDSVNDLDGNIIQLSVNKAFHCLKVGLVFVVEFQCDAFHLAHLDWLLLTRHLYLQTVALGANAHILGNVCTRAVFSNLIGQFT